MNHFMVIERGNGLFVYQRDIGLFTWNTRKETCGSFPLRRFQIMSTRKHYTVTDLEKEFGPLTFGNTLESYRLAEEKSQKDFAKKLGITPQSLCDLEKGRRVPSIERAAKIAKKLGEPVETWV